MYGFPGMNEAAASTEPLFFWAYFVEDQPFYFSAENFYLIIHFGTKPCHQEIFAFINVIVQNHSYLD